MTILGVDEVSFDKFLVLDVEVKNIQNVTKLGYKWTIFPPINFNSYYNGDTNRQFIV